MNSRIYRGTLLHARLHPVRHRFSYPFYVFGFDLDEIPRLDREVIGFGYNRLRPSALHDRDYLHRGPGSIREKLARHLEQHGYTDDFHRIELVTSARYWNYAFNPVSFYRCYGAGDALRCVVAEVNNTFGDRHLYVLPVTSPGSYPITLTCPKEFHVSPFNPMAGHYIFRFHDPAPELRIEVDLVRDGECVLATRMQGRPCPLTSGALARTLLRYPLTTAVTIPRILRQAASLYFRKHLPVFARQPPTHPDTIIQRARRTS